jgi:nitrogen fixation protein FixH
MDAAAIDERRSAWRWFPAGLAVAMLLVFIVNFAMVYWALSTFPGAAPNDGFDESNAYDRVLDATAREHALGWSVAAEARDGRVVLVLTDKSGARFFGVPVAATAERPVGPPETTELAFAPQADGSYRAATALPLKGQWDVMLRIGDGAQQLHTTRRVVAR